MKNTDDFRFEGKPSRAGAKSTVTPFPVSKDEWDTKEDTGKSMKNALYAVAEEVVDMRGGSAELTQTYFCSLVRWDQKKKKKKKKKVTTTWQELPTSPATISSW